MYPFVTSLLDRVLDRFNATRFDSTGMCPRTTLVDVNFSDRVVNELGAASA